jgi:hypothetical protein
MQSVSITTNVVSSNSAQAIQDYVISCQWFSPGSLVSSINKTDHYKITEIMLKVALNTINPPPKKVKLCFWCYFYAPIFYQHQSICLYIPHLVSAQLLNFPLAKSFEIYTPGKYHKRKAKFDFGIYHILCSRVMPLYR